MRSRVALASRQSSSRRKRSAIYPDTDSIRPSSLARRSLSIRSFGRLIASFSVADIPRLYRWRWARLNLIGPAGPGERPPGTPRWLKAPFLRHGALALLARGSDLPHALGALWFEPWSAALRRGRLG